MGVDSNSDWHKKEERGSNFALALLAVLYKLFPRSFLQILLYPVIAYFFITDSTARKASIQFLKKVFPSDATSKLYLKSFKHFYAFGHMILDIIDTSRNKISASEIDWYQSEMIIKRLGVSAGGVILSGHFGCLEVCRAIQRQREKLRIIPLMYLSNSQKFRRFLHKINSNYNFEYIPVENMNAGVAVAIKSCIDKGQYVALLADRPAPNNPSRTIRVSFLGEDANIPEGPFALAWALQADIFTVFAAYDVDQKRYQVIWDRIEIERSHIRDKKTEEIHKLAQSYVRILEREVQKHPFQWFNFYDFWAK